MDILTLNVILVTICQTIKAKLKLSKYVDYNFMKLQGYDNGE